MKAQIKAISSDTHLLRAIPLDHFTIVNYNLNIYDTVVRQK